MSISQYKNKGVIYKLTSPSNKVYIGQSINVKARHASYKAGGSKDQTKLYDAICKYGFENFQVEILFDIDFVEGFISILNKMEKYYIEEFDSVNSGYNCRYGGGNSKHSEESIARMRIAKSVTSDETRKRMSIAASKRVYDAKSRAIRGKSKMKPIIQYSKNMEFIKE
jgi:group I intron endonuclease